MAVRKADQEKREAERKANTKKIEPNRTHDSLLGTNDRKPVGRTRRNEGRSRW
jgi:hypothetical protein